MAILHLVERSLPTPKDPGSNPAISSYETFLIIRHSESTQIFAPESERSNRLQLHADGEALVHLRPSRIPAQVCGTASRDVGLAAKRSVASEEAEEERSRQGN